MADNDIFEVEEQETRGRKAKTPPAYRVYPGSKIAIGSGVGTMWKKRFDAALTAYNAIYTAWDQSFQYYNNSQGKGAGTGEGMQTPRGVFKRGDSTENVVYANLNVLLPALYSKNPDATVNTEDQEDAEFTKTLTTLLNALLHKRDGLNAKPRIKRQCGFAILTNFGVVKLDYTKKDDSREIAVQEITKLSEELTEAKNSSESEAIYGRIIALENTMEVRKKSGFAMKNVLPHNLLIDPYAEQDDGLDGDWMIERVYLNTAAATAQYTISKNEDDEQSSVLAYKPTHKAVFTEGANGSREDGIGLVFEKIDAGAELPTHDSDQERMAFLSDYYTECFLVWDKVTKRVMLFQRDDWKWPMWVWDDPLNITRFFPYFILGFGFSTGGTVTVGESAYYLDQQDEINDINRQISKIRRSIFDYWFYNSDLVNKEEAEKFIDAITGKTSGGPKLLGVAAGEKPIKDMIQSISPPSAEYKELFDKARIFEAIDRVSNTSDALRGTQFKTNTNVAAVESYQDAARMSIGAKVDIVEDMMSDLIDAVAELAVQNMDEQDVTSLIGKQYAANWKQMSLEDYHANYNCRIVAGSTEKPNSVFKKKEAVQLAQAVGQFAQAAPGATLMIMLEALQNAFTSVNIKPEHWDLIKQEVTASMQKGVSTGGAGAEGQPPGGQPPGGGQAPDIEGLLASAPPEIKAKAAQAAQSGADPQQVLAMLQGGGNSAPPQQPAKQA